MLLRGVFHFDILKLHSIDLMPVFSNHFDLFFP